MTGNFWLGFEKRAAPRWVKELRGGKDLGKSFVEKLKSLGLPERTVRHLGTGASQIAEEVLHPHYGRVVRKTPLIRHPGYTKEYLQEAQDTLSHWKKLYGITGGKGPFAHLKGSKGHVGYYEMATPGKKDYGPRLDRLYDKLETQGRSAGRKMMKAEENTPEWKALHKRFVELDKRKDNIRKAMYSVENITPEQRKYVELAKSKGLPMGDLRPANIVGGKIVDFQTGYPPIHAVSLEKGFDPVIFSKKTMSNTIKSHKTEPSKSKLQERLEKHLRKATKKEPIPEKEFTPPKESTSSHKKPLQKGSLMPWLAAGGTGAAAAHILKKTMRKKPHHPHLPAFIAAGLGVAGGTGAAYLTHKHNKDKSPGQ